MYFSLLKFDTINNWNINELMFLFSLIFITYGIFIVFFMALRDFSDWIKHGDIDRVMVRPRGILTQLVLCGADWLAALGHGTFGITLFILSANNVGVEWNAATILYYVISIASGVLIQGGVQDKTVRQTCSFSVFLSNQHLFYRNTELKRNYVLESEKICRLSH